MAVGKKEGRRPTLGIVVILGALVASLGGFLAFINLASQSVQEVTVMPAPESRQAGMVYFVKGSNASSQAWRAARNQITRGQAGTIRLTEADLNSWASSAFGRVQRRAPAKGEAEAEPVPGVLGIEVTVTGVNFRIVEGLIQVSAYLELPDLLPGQRFIYQMRGTLAAKRSGGVQFVPREGSIGRAPVGNIPIIGGLFHRTVLGLVAEAPEMVALSEELETVTEIKVDERHIELTVL